MSSDRSGTAELRQLFDNIDAAKSVGDWARAAELIERALTDPDLEELYSRGSVADELVDLYGAHMGAAEAEALVLRAEASAWFTPAYARLRLAGLKLAAGQVDRALALYDAARADHEQPVTDVHLLFEAGVMLADAGHHERAADWLADGIRVGIEQHDDDGMLEEIVEARLASLEALGRSLDAAQRTAATHLRLYARYQRPEQRQEQPAVPFFPRSEYERARAVWPDLADVFLGSYEEYAAVVERQLRQIEGQRPVLVPLRVNEYVAWCRDRGLDAGAALARARYAAEAADRGERTAWPPSRNDMCWCDSGSKYKKCHGVG